ncbi:glycogen synthase GlgA [Bythopirellula polymerisocia]|uniref:Glycogen synthase n=1 Tax=Bythopirellula polymerisocia TaxID=2528003 RepID=A0A5C6D011_9BACT|nr:glycogen synthase GlgA [Bythopirellula polymerisocia]TWU29525.1 Glycogen synthase [Bythopirellula polymerisocia]
MNILFATAEAAPFSKTGGLGDVCGSLPLELYTLGHRPALILPAFRQIYQAGLPIDSTGISFEIPIGQKRVGCQILESHLPNSAVPVYFIENGDYYDRPQLYGEDGEDYRDNCERFVFYSRAVLEAILQLDLGTELIHCNDWCAGLIPAYLKTLYAEEPPFDQMASLFTIHNLAYQGSFWHWDMALTGIDWKYFNWRYMEFFGNLNFMKTAIAFADVISTVSPTYAQEILRPPLSCALEGALEHRRDDLFGIINGVDYNDWNPAIDSYLGTNTYDQDSLKVGKSACKEALQREMNLPVNSGVPLVAAVGRLVDQKGFDLISRVIERWAPDRAVQWVILGTGDPKYHQVLGRLAAERPDKVAVRLEFSNELAHKIEAGADMFLMPSQYEPCGLNQLYSLKYGTVPIVRRTGGLADTVVDVSAETLADRSATGFSFSEYTALALSDTLERACTVFADKDVWQQLVQTGMRQDWSWGNSAREYSNLYKRTLAQARQGVLS